jgi:murein endopeptidase
MRGYARVHPEAPPVYVGDLSKKDGGPFPPHVSHQSGRDVDIGFVHLGRHEGARRFVRATATNLDLQRTWDLLEALVATGQVAYVFLDYGVQGLLVQWATERGINPAVIEERFQYPRGRSAAHGLVRHWRGHADHLHVRFQR